MLIVVLNANNGEVSIERVDSEEDIWDLGYKESECSWMEIQSVTQVLSAVTSFYG